MSSLSTHTSFFGKRHPISISRLMSGMIVEFSYSKIKNGVSVNSRYVVMIVDPKFKRPQDKEYFTHAISLDVAPRAAIVEVAYKSGITDVGGELQSKRVCAEHVLVEGTSRDFYQEYVSQLISGQGKGSYRTFKTLRINSIQLIDYIFPDYIDYYDPITGELDKK